MEDPVEELLVIVSCPVTAPAAVGSNCTLIVAVWVGFNVMGNVTPEALKPVPLTAAALTVTGAVPVDDRITDCVAGVFRFTFPNATLAALMLNVGTPGPSCSEKVFAVLPALAVKVAL
jgi:hypothetical protein